MQLWPEVVWPHHKIHKSHHVAVVDTYIYSYYIYMPVRFRSKKRYLSVASREMWSRGHRGIWMESVPLRRASGTIDARSGRTDACHETGSGTCDLNG